MMRDSNKTDFVSLEKKVDSTMKELTKQYPFLKTDSKDASQRHKGEELAFDTITELRENLCA
jgi:hypothetical protein